MQSLSGFLGRLLIISAILIALDLYAYQAIKVVTANQSWRMYARWGYWIFHGLFYLYMIVVFWLATGGTRGAAPHMHWMATMSLVFYVPKVILILFLLGEDVFRGGKWMIKNAGVLFASPESSPRGDLTTMSRSQFLSLAGIFVAGIPFLAFGWGIINGRYNFQVKRVKLKIKGLPSAFEGFKFAQISDLHTGSFSSREEVKRGIQMVNDENPDMIFFTGDLVNNVADELEGYDDVYSILDAPQGVFSIIGNHDYGDYIRWPSQEAKDANFKRLISRHADFGWKILLNENHVVEKDGAKLAVIGVENWSARNFVTTGDLAKASQGTEDADVKVLLSHDPTHWDAEVRPNYPDINVTFSGHTHGAQMGVDIPGIRWSPAQWVYKQWAGLYQEGDQYLYVNQGFGHIGYMGRVGFLPEITVVELTKA